MDVKWLFFDMGSTLIDESLAYDLRLRDMIAGTGLSFEEVSYKRKELARQGQDGNSAVIAYYGLKKTPWHFEAEMLFPEVKEVLSSLSYHGYRLGILANQAPGAAHRLNRWGIGHFFSVIASSGELGVAKPEPAIFEAALTMAGCPASQAVMIGDRLDNDILPAWMLGMHTVWLRSGTAAYQSREQADGLADAVVDSLTDLVKLFCKEKCV